jgi:hypothetical protein
MLATDAGHIDRMANCRSRVSVSVPFVAGSKGGSFTSVASSSWAFQQAETAVKSGTFYLCAYVGSPVAGVLVVKHRDDSKSIGYLTDLGNEKYGLAEVLTVAVEKSGDQFVATEPRRGWYGYGNTEEQAIGRFASSLVEELEVLTERENRLSAPLRDELAQLKQVVVPHR